MEFLISLPWRVTSLFYNPSPGPPAMHRRTTLTKQQVVAVVCVTATVYILMPDYFLIKELLFVPLLGWLAGALFDLRESLLAAWDGAPGFLKKRLTSSANGSGGHHSAPRGLDLGRIWATMTTQFEELVAQFKIISIQLRRMATTQLRELAAWVRATAVQLRRIATTRLEELAARARTTAAQLRRIAQDAAIKFLHGALRFLNPSKGPPNPNKHDSGNVSEPPRRYTPPEWHGILVFTPPVHGYGFTAPLGVREEPVREEPIRWENHYDTSVIPKMADSFVARAHLSFCLVPASVWESRHSSIVEKLMTGLYWDIKGPEGGYTGAQWNEEQIRGIIGLQDLGPVDTEPGLSAVQSCHRHYVDLRRDWNYMNISWNDVDFAIILGRLVTGKGAALTLGAIFALSESLRSEEILGVRAKRFGKADLEDPSIGAIFIRSIKEAIKARDRLMWDRRKLACRDLLTKYQQLDVVFDVKTHSSRWTQP